VTTDPQAEVQRYLDDRWPANRITAYCRPETRNLGWRAAFTLRKEMTGQLHPVLDQRIGNATWYAEEWAAGKEPISPIRYSVENERGSDKWILEVGTAGYEICPMMTS
jgi:hypothetical protein